MWYYYPNSLNFIIIGAIPYTAQKNIPVLIFYGQKEKAYQRKKITFPKLEAESKKNTREPQEYAN